MSEYIEREALREELRHCCIVAFDEKSGEPYVIDTPQLLRRTTVSADVAPVEVIRKVLKDCLSDERYCTREWAAWSYGTMTQDDFIPIDVDEIVDDIVKTAKMDGGDEDASL